MNCHEFQKVMRLSIDGGLDSGIRKEVALHLADCEECLKLLNDDKFWDGAVISLLDRQAPEGLRSEILGDLDGQSGLSSLGWKKQLKLAGWGARRNNMSLRDWVMIGGILVVLLWLVPFLTGK